MANSCLSGETDGNRFLVKVMNAMQRDYPLVHFHVISRDKTAITEAITAKDLMDQPLIISRQAFQNSELRNFFHHEQEKLNIVATYSLLFNGSLMVEEGLGYAICFDKLINVSGDSNLCFRPLEPQIKSDMHIIWKKYQVFSKPTQKFLQKLQEIG